MINLRSSFKTPNFDVKSCDFSAGITKAVDITLDVIEDVLAQIQTIPPVQIQIVKQPTKSELFL